MRTTLVKLISRFVGNKCVTFDGSRVYYWKVPMIVLPIKGLVHLQDNLYKTLGNDTRKILFSLGKLQGKNGTNILLEKYKVKPDEKDFSFFFEQTEFVGIGKMTDFEIDFQTLNWKWDSTNSPNAKIYKEVLGTQDHAVCDYVGGLFCGALQALSRSLVGNDEELVTIEEQCMSKGDDKCIFITKKESDWSQIEEEKHKLPLKFEALDNAKNKMTLSMLLRAPTKCMKDPRSELWLYLRRLKGERPFTFSEGGIVSLMNYDSLITPIDILMLLYNVLTKKYPPEKVDEVFYSSGQFLGKDFASNLFSELNFTKSNQKQLRMLLDQISLFGLGKVEITKFDMKNDKYLVRVYSTPGHHHKHIFGPTKIKADVFIAGIISGAINFITERDVKIIEDSCAASGNQYCVFKSI